MPNNAVATCPRGCGYSGRPHHVAAHQKRCLAPHSIERITEIIEAKRTASGCLVGRLGPNKSSTLQGVRAYVLVCTIAHGTPVGPVEVCHSCDNPGCIEPTHLRWDTHAANMRDMHLRDRFNGATRWDREQRLAAGLDGSAARAARWADHVPNTVTRVCAICANEFTRKTREPSRVVLTCSRPCAGKLAAISRTGNN